MTGPPREDLDRDILLERRIYLKTVTAAIRFKHQREADRELHRVLPQAQKAFDDAVLHGELPSSVDIRALLGLV